VAMCSLRLMYVPNTTGKELESYVNTKLSKLYGNYHSKLVYTQSGTVKL